MLQVGIKYYIINYHKLHNAVYRTIYYAENTYVGTRMLNNFEINFIYYYFRKSRFHEF